LAGLGVVVGAVSTLYHPSYKLSSKDPSDDLKLEGHPFLHTVLLNLLTDSLSSSSPKSPLPASSHAMNGDSNGSSSSSSSSSSNPPGMNFDTFEMALELSKYFVEIPQFIHSLELLLHQVLEQLEDKLVTEELVTVVARFLQQFPMFYPDIVALCARKRDPSIWNVMFAICGAPKDLFMKAMTQGNYHTAASYLRIIQEISGNKESRTCALKLLEIALQLEDYPVFYLFLKIDANSILLHIYSPSHTYSLSHNYI
jgi:hypothetical protein